MIGTDVDGTSSLANDGSGVEIAASNVQVGGTGPGAGNVISGNAQFGVVILPSFFFFTPANDNLVQGNFIGTDKTGTIPSEMGRMVLPFSVQFIGATNNTIGGTTAGRATPSRITGITA